LVGGKWRIYRSPNHSTAGHRCKSGRRKTEVESVSLVRKHEAVTTRRLILIAMLAVLVGSGVVLVWSALGEADKSAQLSTLLILSHSLLESARTEGRFPVELNEEVVGAPKFSALVDYDNLEYMVSGQPYVEKVDRILFRERKTRRYGWTRGWYEIRQEGWVFHEGDPPASEPSEPGIPRTRRPPVP
jgi:hypothetical protein